MKPLRVGLIGTGAIMRDAHIGAWTGLRDEGRVDLAAACDVRRPAAEALADQHGIPEVYDDAARMLRRVDLDLVDIATPNAAHAPAAVAALRAGCHVYCEKPLAPTPREVRRLVRARDRAGKRLMTGQHLRFEGKHAALKRFADAGVLGEMYYARASALRRRGAPGWGAFLTKRLSGGGPLIDIGVHVLDLTLWLMGFPKPVTVSGVAPRKLADREGLVNRPGWGEWRGAGQVFDVEDFAVGFVRFETGAVLVLEASFLLNVAEEESIEAMICGTAGGIDVSAGTVVTEEHGVMRVSRLENYAAPKPHAAAIRAFVDAIEGGGPTPVPAEETLVVMAILDGIYRSHERGGREVRVSAEPPGPVGRGKRRG